MPNTPALESIFANAEQTAASMIAAATTGINSKINTIEDAEAMVASLSTEAAKFNNHLLAISNAMHQLEIGDISKDEALATIAPCVQELKAACTALKFADAQMSDSTDITEEEIAILRELIIGTKAAAEARLVELKTSSTPGQISTESSGVIASVEGMEPAEEGLFAKGIDKNMQAIRKSTEAKTAQALFNNAKKMWSYGQKDKAKEYLAKAQALYEKCLKKVMSEGHFQSSTDTVVVGNNVLSAASHSQQTKNKITASRSAAAVRAYFEDRIDSCRALLMQWENKAGKATYSETKAALKKERSEAKAAQRQARKDAKDAKKAGTASGATESYLDSEENLDPATEAYIKALEAEMDSLEIDEWSAALEADTVPTEDGEPAGKGGKFRALLAKFKKAKKEGNDAEAAQASKELDSTAKEIASDAQAASTPEEKKKSRSAIKIAAVALTSIAAIGGGAVLAKAKLGKKKVDDGNENSIASDAKVILSLLPAVKNSVAALPAAKGSDGATTEAVTVAESTAPISFLDGEENLDPVVEAYVMSLESYMNGLEMDMALEADTVPTEDGEPAGKGGKFRALLAKFKKAKKEGNDAEAAQASKDATSDLNAAASEANAASTPEEIKKSNKKLIGILSAIAALAALAGAGIGIKKWHDANYAKVVKAPDQKHADVWKDAMSKVREFFTRKPKESATTALAVKESFSDLMISLTDTATEGCGTKCAKESFDADCSDDAAIEEAAKAMLQEDGYDDLDL